MAQKDIDKKISAEAYFVTQQHGTEPAFSGDLNDNKEPGDYLCVCCGVKLFDHNSKYDSGGQAFGNRTMKRRLLITMIMKLVT